MSEVIQHGTATAYNRRGCRCSDCREAVRLVCVGRREAAAANGGVYPGPITHGDSGYRNYGCRCSGCCSAHNARLQSQVLARKAATKAAGGIAPVEVHNDHTYTNWGCRCAECTADHAARGGARQRARRAQRRSSLSSSPSLPDGTPP